MKRLLILVTLAFTSLLLGSCSASGPNCFSFKDGSSYSKSSKSHNSKTRLGNLLKSGSGRTNVVKMR